MAEDQASDASPEGGDYLLEHMVRVVDETGIEIGITLHVGGIVVSGLLVSGEVYMQGCANHFENARGAQEAREALSAFMRRTGDAQPGRERGSKDGSVDSEEATELTGYVHLGHAQVYQSGSAVTEQGTWWRGRLDRVDGFHFGRLSSPS